MNASLTAAADPHRPMPSGTAARRDAIHAALASLQSEQRRLARLGFELPLARCHDQLRYWRFLDGLFAAAESGTGPSPVTRSWRAAPR